MKIRMGLSTIILSVLVPVGVLAETSDPDWFYALELQMANKHGCEVTEYVRVEEGELAGRKTYDARVKCRDGRQFDANRTEPDGEFTINQCKIMAC